MTNLLKDHFFEITSLIALIVGAVLVALHRIGWLRIGRPEAVEQWDGHDRRQCLDHPLMQQKVCSLFTKLEDLEELIGVLTEKVNTATERLQYILGSLEQRWGKRHE